MGYFIETTSVIILRSAALGRRIGEIEIQPMPQSPFIKTKSFLLISLIVNITEHLVLNFITWLKAAASLKSITAFTS